MKDHSTRLMFPSTAGGSFIFQKGSYLIDRKATRQVWYKGHIVKGLVEAIYNEGNPIPHGSTKDLEVTLTNNFRAKIDSAQHKPAVSLLDKLRGK